MCVDVALKTIGGSTTAAKFREAFGRYIASLPNGLPGGDTPDGVLRELVRRGWVAMAFAHPGWRFRAQPSLTRIANLLTGGDRPPGRLKVLVALAARCRTHCKQM
jgi:hypothetical protein